MAEKYSLSGAMIWIFAIHIFMINADFPITEPKSCDKVFTFGTSCSILGSILCDEIIIIQLSIALKECSDSVWNSWYLKCTNEPYFEKFGQSATHELYLTVNYSHHTAVLFNWLCWGITISQPLWVILCRLSERGRKEIEEIVEMKEKDRQERGTGMKWRNRRNKSY